MAKLSSIPETTTQADRRRVTADNITALLAVLGNTPRERGLQYETLRSKLIFFFSRRSLQFPEDLADEVLDRLGQRISDGIQIASPPAFALGIARHVAQEQSAKTSQTQVVDDAFWNNVPAHLPTQIEEKEEKIVRMERCLKKLPPAEAILLKGYYLAMTDNPMQVRKNLAEDMGISQNALRQRVFLARQSLRTCMDEIERKKKK